MEIKMPKRNNKGSRYSVGFWVLLPTVLLAGFAFAQSDPESDGNKPAVALVLQQGGRDFRAVRIGE